MKYNRNNLYDAKLDENDGIYGFNYPWTLSWYLSITGSEYFHIYLWICKDLSWTQEWYLLSLIFGTLSLMWYVVLAYHALSTRNGEEIWNVLGGILWLFANFWWMAGEIHDVQYPYANPISDTAHYTSSLLWVCGNITWALGEFFFGNYDNPLILWQDSAIALKTARWYASWLLLFSFIPLILMYSIWIPLSLSDKLGPVDRDEILFEGKLRLFDYGSLSTDMLVREDVAANSDTEYVRSIISNNELDHENSSFIKKIFR
eukprot:gene17054-22564_t